jgi:hypothetical protein|tara:strand:+ start:399 stop:2201 length:1803 start_codon:yes stop_codon:yes gene_type:complete
MTEEKFESVLERAERTICEMGKPKNSNRLKVALEERVKRNRSDNPFNKVKGWHDITVLSKENLNKVKDIQTEIVMTLLDTNDDVFFMKPQIRDKVFVIDDSGDSKSYKLGRLLNKQSPDVRKKIQKLMTQYPSKHASESARIFISDDPVDILRKSSSRSWVEQSCERIGGEFDMGPFSDIANNNAIAYFFFGNNKEPSGRFMLRWCEDGNGEVNVGIEPTMYPSGQSFSWTFYDELSKIIKRRGFGKYEECITPYEYGGYSDQMGEGHTKINYKSPGETGLMAYASDPNIARNVARVLLTAGNPAVRAALAENPGVCEFVSQDDNVVQRILNQETNDTVLSNLFFNCRDVPLNCEQANRLRIIGDNSVRSWVASKRIIPDECACDILRDITDDGEEVYSIAGNEHVPEICACDIFKDIAESKVGNKFRNRGPNIRMLRNEGLPEECACDIFTKISESDDVAVRASFSGYFTHLPDECACDIFTKLSEDNSETVRSKMATSRNIPDACACDIFTKLLNEKSDDADARYYIFEGLSMNDHIPSNCACDIFKKISTHGSAWTRDQVASNKGIPDECLREILDKLSVDTNEMVRETVNKRLLED